jgi:hypothetical protein
LVIGASKLTAMLFSTKNISINAMSELSGKNRMDVNEVKVLS